MNDQQQQSGPDQPARLGAKTISQLRAVPILASLDEEKMHCLDGVGERHLVQDELLVRQGDTTRNFWILLNGSLRLSSLSPEGHEQVRYLLEPGAAFGEVPLLANMPWSISMRALESCELLELSEDQFWSLMTQCPEVRKQILGNMATRLAKMQDVTFQQQKMASLGTMAAGLMHELNNPVAAARRSSAHLRENLLRMHNLTADFARASFTEEQKQCMFDLQVYALASRPPKPLTSLEHADAEEALLTWMEAAAIPDAWKLAPTLAAIGMDQEILDCAKGSFAAPVFAATISWLEALVSSMQLVGTIEESIGRVTDLVKAVKSYAYEGRGQKLAIEINSSIEATLVILGHKIREKQIKVNKEFGTDLPLLQTQCHGLNQIWTNLLDNAIDAAPQQGTIGIKTWSDSRIAAPGTEHIDLCILVSDNGSGIPLEDQPRIFDPFYTTKPVGVGTGLGLDIVHRIVEQYGGTIRFSSTPGDTEFVVRLPSEETSNETRSQTIAQPATP